MPVVGGADGPVATPCVCVVEVQEGHKGWDIRNPECLVHSQVEYRRPILTAA
jgi:hypothetical protein